MAKPRELCKEVRARRAAMDGGTALGSWVIADPSFSEDKEDVFRRAFGGAVRVGMTTGLDGVAAGATQSCFGFPCGIGSGLLEARLGFLGRLEPRASRD